MTQQPNSNSMSYDYPKYHIRSFRLLDAKAVQNMIREHFPEVEPYSVDFLIQLVKNNSNLVKVIECRTPIEGCPRFNETSVAFVCAYYVCVPLRRQKYDEFKKGEIAEDDLRVIDILPCENSECLLILDLVREPRCEDKIRLGSRIYSNLVKELKPLIQENMNIQEVAAIISDNRAKEMVKKYGFTQLKNYRHPKAEFWTFWYISRNEIIVPPLIGKHKWVDIFRNLWKVIETKPSFLGFSIDLKKLITVICKWCKERKSGTRKKFSH